jgi:DNA-binding transcriptional MerR regulator
VALLWTLSELVAQVAARIGALPAPRNGQVRAVPDDRTVRYYATIGLLDRPAVMRGRTAFYGPRHLAQVVAVKRLQTMGRSLAEIQALWPTLDDATLARMSGVALGLRDGRAARPGFWKGAPGAPAPAAAGDEVGRDVAAASVAAAPAAIAPTPAVPGALATAVGAAGVELRIELAPHVVLLLSGLDEGVAILPADVRAIRAAAAPLLAALAARQLASREGGDHP